MRSVSRSCLFLLLFFVLFPALRTAVSAESESVYFYDNNVITGFEASDQAETVNIDHKVALIELEKRFPAALTVHLGGEAFYQVKEDGSRILSDVKGYSTQKIDAVWKCFENYDEKLDIFHFFPDLDGYETASGLDLPVITVNVLGEIEIPPLIVINEPPLHTTVRKRDDHQSKTALPEYYNPYEEGLLPDLRNQNPLGTCWAFATIAALEGDLIHDGNADTSVDLSELHLAYFSYHDTYDEKGCNNGDSISVYGVNYQDHGGTCNLTINSLSNMIGPVEESVVPYSLADGYSPDPSEGRTGTYQVTGAYMLDPADISVIKNEILNHGMVASNCYIDYSVYSDTYNSYYKAVDSGTNHIFALVGWDDHFPRENFISGTPEGDGAWLVRNSWARENEYSISGYFWVSYYDKGLHNAFSFDVQPWRYDHVYSYDSLPYSNWYTVSSGQTVAQMFHIDGRERVKAIGFYSEDPDEDLLFSLSDGTRTATESFSITHPGFYLIPLSDPLTIRRDSDVAVEYTLTFEGQERNVFAEIENLDWYDNVNFTSHTESDGMVIYWYYSVEEGGFVENFNTGRDSKLKLFTDDIIPDSPDLVLPADLTVIESEAFAGDTFTYVKLPERAVSIGRNAFADCLHLVYVYVPEEVNDIDDEAFGSLTDLVFIGVSGSYAEDYAESHGFDFIPVS